MEKATESEDKELEKFVYKFMLQQQIAIMILIIFLIYVGKVWLFLDNTFIIMFTMIQVNISIVYVTTVIAKMNEVISKE